MAINLTKRLDSLKNQTAKTPQLILEFQDIDSTFSTTVLLDLARWDNAQITWDDGITYWDGTAKRAGNEPIIDLKGSKRTLSQQIRPDKSSTQSVPTFNIKLQDKNNKIAQQFSFDNIEEQLGKKCNVYLTLSGGIHPFDSIPILFGFCDEVSFAAGSLTLSISHASNLQRQAIYSQVTTELSSPITDSATVIPVISTTGFIEAFDAQKSFLQIEDEIMQVVSSSPTSFTVQRGALGTSAVEHDTTEVLSYYTLTGKPIDLALKLLLSSENNAFESIGYNLEAIEYVNTTTSVNNALIFDSPDIEAISGLVAGDTVRVSGTSSNDGDYTIFSFGLLDDGRSYIRVEENLSLEVTMSASVEYRSKYNVLKNGAGLGLEPREVDVAGMEEINKNFSSEFFEYTDLPIKDGIDNAKDFIEKELFYPSNIYSIPRKARISARYTVSPLSIDITPTLNTQTVQNVEQLKIKRSIHKFYYNAIQYRYNREYVGDRFLRTKTFLSGESSRIKTGNNILTIPSDGIRQTQETENNLQRLANRLLARYQLASVEVKNITVLFKDSLNLEVGDIIPFGGSDLQIPDPQTGKRNLEVALYEIVNKSLNIENGRVSLTIAQTGFSIAGVRAVIAPSSLVDSRSTASEIVVKKDIDTNQFAIERLKYEQYLGAKVRIRSKDYTYDESSTIAAFPAGNENAITLNPALPSTPPTDAIFELDIYGDQPINEAGDLVKIKYCFTMEQKNIVSAVDGQTFDVDDTEGLFEGQKITVHAGDYAEDNFPETATIDNINLNTITLESALSFVPTANYKLETYSFSDGKDGYVAL
jgi:hypothetical protein